MTFRKRKLIETTNRLALDAPLDERSAAVPMIDYYASVVNQGLAFEFFKVWLDVAASAECIIELRIPAGFNVILVSWDAWTNSEKVEMIWREGPTIATPGTNEVDAINRNRSGDFEALDVDPIKIYDNAAGSSGGKKIEHGLIGGGALIPAATGSGDRTLKGPWILGSRDEATVYTFGFKNLDSVARDIAINTFEYVDILT
jgi:hypothetical protein